ncbi:unnamed protein product [Adineta ricciae]|uniref:GDP-mannose 4,6-dehydratase n=1 Tax=Adineta ricciae TaxID=249248 RepID=A0A815UVT4_ADIRI|nr:unnamed protein product [Adineta ricciae]
MRSINPRENSNYEQQVDKFTGGEVHSVREFVELAFQEIGQEIFWEGEGIDEVGKEKGTNITRVTLDPNYFGLTEMTVLVGDPKRAQEKLKWSPKTKFKELVKEMVAADISLITTAAS